MPIAILIILIAFGSIGFEKAKPGVIGPHLERAQAAIVTDFKVIEHKIVKGK